MRTVDGQSLQLILGKREVKFEQQKGRATGMETHGRNEKRPQSSNTECISLKQHFY